MYRKRYFSEFQGERLLELLKVTRVGIRTLLDDAPIQSEIYKALQDFWESSRKLGETVTGDPTYFNDPPVTAGERTMHSKLVSYRTWEG